jgi:hypothetical protein
MVDEQKRKTKAGGQPESLDTRQPPITPTVKSPKRQREMYCYRPIQKNCHYRGSPERHFKPQGTFSKSERNDTEPMI